MANKPEAKFRAGQVTATVWKNQIEIKGVTKDVYNVDIVKNYKDGEEWKTTSSFDANQLPNVSVVSKEAYAFIKLKKE